MTNVSTSATPRDGTEFTWEIAEFTWDDADAGKSWETAYEYDYGLSVGEELIPVESSGRQLSKPFADSLSIASSISRQTGKSLDEALQIVDGIENLFAVYRTFDESFAVSDDATKSFGLNIAEVIHILERHIRNAEAVIADLAVYNTPITFEEFQSRFLALEAPVGYSTWADFLPGDYRYQRALFEIALDAGVTDNKIEVAAWTLRVDIPEIIDRGSAFVGASGLTIQFNRQFNDIPEVAARIKDNPDAGIPEITATKEDFFIKIPSRSNPGTYVPATISWIAVGA